MAKFYIKQNDTSPAIRVVDSLLVGNLVGATVVFNMRDANGVVKVNRQAATFDDSTGELRYDWAAADTDTAGRFESEFEVTYADTSIETFPNFEYIDTIISAHIA